MGHRSSLGSHQVTSLYAVREFLCGGCGSYVRKRCPKGSKFCSLPCYRSAARPERRTGGHSPCSDCGASVYRPGFAKSANVFCSVVCHNHYQSRNKTVHLCKMCGKVFRWSPSRAVAQNPTYCSIPCRNNCPEWKQNSVIAGNMKQCRSLTPNRLERAGADILRSLGVDYVEQSLIAEKFVVDVEVVGKKMVIQWDGDYWHGYRADGDCRPLDRRQQKRSMLDRSQDAYMAKAGYTVLRFWEHEVHKQKESVRAAICRAIQQAAA